jgi:hypothetical protein
MRKILYSPGYGAGWSSWAYNIPKKWMCQYQPIIDFLEKGGSFTYEDCQKEPLHPLLEQLKKDAKDQFGVDHVCVLGAEDLEIYECDDDTQVRITEYDGAESVVVGYSDYF